MRLFPVGEVTLSKDDPLSVDLTMVPDRPTATKVLFPKVTSWSNFVVGEVTLSQDEPLSVDLIMVPLSPTPIKVLFAKMTPQRLVAVGEVTLSKDEPLSVDLTISLNPAPYPPTAINTPEPEEEELSDEDEVVSPVLEEELSFFAHEETSTAMPTTRTNQYNILFILFLYRKFCKIKTTHLHLTPIGLYYKNRGKLWNLILFVF
jgi:hypothetical protein